ncbi:DDE-type integrase/transposase/recombinase, partial [Cutibacterium acnes]
MSNQSRAELVSVLRNEYKVAPTRRDKSALVERCISVTGYSRKHALKLLNEKDRHEKLVPKRNTSLDHEAREALVLAWEVSRHICGKRLVHMLPEIVENMTRFGHWRFSKQAQTQLLSVSAATIDRALKEERLRAPRSLSTTKRAALVKKQVPVKTFAEWSDVIPGFFEIDTVSHCSSDPNGPFLYSLNMTDVATTWTVPIGLYRKTAKDVIGAFKKVQLPFPLKGVDFDNGSEFLNQDFIDWCKENKVTYTRSRPYKKNDQCFVEEKNGSVIRKNVGRERYVGLKAFRKLCELYGVLDDYFNFFVPCQKLLFKKRNGAKCYKKHDAAKTPYDRVLESAHVSDSCKEALKARKESLDMFSLFQKL